MSDQKPPRGIWYEASKNRWRVRLYKNKRSHLAGYYPTYERALEVYTKLKNHLMKSTQNGGNSATVVEQKSIIEHLLYPLMIEADANRQAQLIKDNCNQAPYNTNNEHNIS